MLALWLSPNAGRADPPVLGEQLRVALALPFNWMTFYLMVLFFAGGHALYALRCPAIVRQFESFNDFRARHLGVTQLIQSVWELVRQMPPSDLERFHQLFKIALQLEPAGAAGGDALFEEVAGRPDAQRRMRLTEWYSRAILAAHHEGLLSDLFDVVRHQAGLLRPTSILLCLVLMRLGLVMLALVVVQTGLCMFRLAGLQRMTLCRLLFDLQ